MDPTGFQSNWGSSLEEQDAHSYRMNCIWSADPPWHPRAAMPPSFLTNTPGTQHNIHDPQFQIYQPHPTISECDTSPQDSAYGSGPTLGETASSIIDAELGNHFDPLLFDQARSQIDQLCGDFRASLSDSSSPNPVPAPDQDAPARLRAEPKLHCQHCKLDLKTKAQLNKHIQRHEKPHLCPYQGCKRSNAGCGFGTPNDLLRHKRTVHKEFDRTGPPFYVCTHEPCRSKKLQKRWPRADNFRSHLARQHPEYFKIDDDLQGYIYIHPEECRPYLQGVGQGIGPADVDISTASPFLEGEQAFHEDNILAPASQEPPTDFAMAMGQIDTFPPWPHPSPIVVMNDRLTIANEVYAEQFTDLADDFNVADDVSNEMASGTLESPAIFEDDDSLHDFTAIGESRDDLGREHGAWAASESAMDGAALDIDDMGSVLSDSDQAAEETAGVFTADILERNLIEAQPYSSRIIKILQSLPPQLLKTALERDQGLQTEELTMDKDDPDLRDKETRQSCQKATYKCPECPKAFGRQCELKKHSKRHAKPYGCTFKDCDKTFGSKNDWKRHESNQHSTLETWTCDLPGCLVVRHRQESFRSHLLKDHRLSNQLKLVEEKLERCRTGRHCDPRFWCGFCVEVIEIQEPGVNAWKRRCDHIDDHLWGKGGLPKKNMADWVFVPGGEEKAVGGEDSQVHTGHKRKAEDATDHFRLKKQKGRWLMWSCCNCSSASGSSIDEISPNCLECHHIRCLFCTQEMVSFEE